MSLPAHLRNILSVLGPQCKPSGERPYQHMGLCPIHSDGKHSLSVGVGDNGKVILECLTGGCHWLDILKHIGLKPADCWPDDEPVEQVAVSSVSHEQWAAWSAAYCEFLASKPHTRTELLAHLSLPESIFTLFPEIGSRNDHPSGECWTFPERDAAGRITGLGLRFRDGTKSCVSQSRRGLIVPPGWQTRPGPLYMPEGASDTLALSAAGFAAVGRPGNCQKLKLIAEFITANVIPDRVIVWLGENDKKTDGKWPGRDGSMKAAKKVADMTGREIQFQLPPDDAKDVRAWLVKATQAGASWADAGPMLVTAMTCRGRTKISLSNEDELTTNSAVVVALATDPDLFTRINSIVRVIQRPAHETQNCQFPPGPQIAPVSAATLREHISSRVNFVVVKKTEETPVRPPDWCVKAVHDRQVWPGIRYLETVVDYPVLRPDGTLLIEPGYDAKTGIYYAPMGEPPQIPDVIDADAAQRACQELQEVVTDFPFHKPVHIACWLAGLLTPLARFAFRGPVPLFLIDGNAPGAGKGLIADTVAIILTGREFAVTTLSAEDEEMRKRITAIALNGDRLVLLDNVAGSLGGAVLDAMLTCVEWEDRILMTNTTVKMPLWATWFATGNNIELVGDIPRRIMPIRLETPEQNPEERTNFKHPKLREWVRTHRQRLLSSALTILLAYQKAGRPTVPMKEMGGYEAWSAFVRSALIWVGQIDPAVAKEEIRGGGHVVVNAMDTILQSWEALSPEGKGMTCNQIINTVFPKHSDTPLHLVDLAEAITSVLTRLNGSSLGYKFRQFRGRVRNGRYLDTDGSHAGTLRWAVFSTVTKAVVKKPKKQASTTSDGGDGGDGGQVPGDAGKKQEQKFTELERGIPSIPTIPTNGALPKIRFSELDD